MRFIASYSGGKDSVFSIYKSIKKGLIPNTLLTTCDPKNKHSWFHNIQYDLLNKASKALDIPLFIVNTEEGKYTSDFEDALYSLKQKGSDVCVFGDIDIEAHKSWCNDRCVNVGLKSSFPLWNMNRKEIVHEFIEVGFKALITVINAEKMDSKHIGKVLTHELIEELEKSGTDVCGEQGEYHTFVFDGPIFKNALDLKEEKIIENKNQIRLIIK